MNIKGGGSKEWVKEGGGVKVEQFIRWKGREGE